MSISHITLDVDVDVDATAAQLPLTGECTTATEDLGFVEELVNCAMEICQGEKSMKYVEGIQYICLLLAIKRKYPLQ